MKNGATRLEGGGNKTAIERENQNEYIVLEYFFDIVIHSKTSKSVSVLQD